MNLCSCLKILYPLQIISRSSEKMSGVGKTRSGRVLKKPEDVYKQNLVMNHHACSKYKTKNKKRAQNKEQVKQHRMAQSHGKKQKKGEKGRKKIKPKHKGTN